jgi:hypothetical protein
MEHRRHERALSSELANDPEPVAWRLVIDLTDALIGRSFEPFHRVPSQPLRVECPDPWGHGPRLAR